MATHVESPLQPAPSGRRRTMWALFFTVATVACAVVVVGTFTFWADLLAETAFWAGLGVMGFGAKAYQYWQAPQEGQPLWDLWWGAVFWAYFALGLAGGVYWHLFHADDPAPGFVLVILSVFVALMLWAAITEGRKAWTETRVRRSEDS